MAIRLQLSLLKFFQTRHFRPSSKPKCQSLVSNSTRFPTPLGPDSVPSTNPKFLRPAATYLSSFGHPFGQTPQTRPWTHQTRSINQTTEISTESGTPELDVTKEVDFINRCFAEAREEIEMAMESKETVYFNEEAECAREAVRKVMENYEGLLGKLPQKEKETIQRSMGLKIEQLKAELQQLDD